MKFNFSHIKERYRASLSDKTVSLHATLAEMLGTGIVVLIGTSAVQLATDATKRSVMLAAAGGGAAAPDPISSNNRLLMNAVIFGLTYFAAMCATRHHGGAHLNPAITVASLLAGVTSAIQAVVFIIAQVLGAIIASAIVLGLTPDDDRDDSLLGGNFYVGEKAIPGLTKSRALGVEIIATFVLVYVYLQCFSHPRSEHKALAPLAVGLAYTALLATAGAYSSGSLNPARTLGPAAVSGEGDDLWIWIFGPLIGAIIAVPMHLLSVTDLPKLDSDGRVVKESAVDVESAKTSV